MRFRGVLFDFGHTLFDTLPPADHCRSFGNGRGRLVDEAEFASVWAGVRDRSRLPEELAKGRDLSAALHRRCWLELLGPFDGLAPGLASYVYESECSAEGWRPYPDARPVLESLRARDVKIGVVSDCGWDVREAFVHHDLVEFIDAFVLSYEHGVAKPAPELFKSACDQLDLVPTDVLMVGDSPLTDGGAVTLGIACLILPTTDRTASPALSAVLDLAFSDH